MGVRTSYRLPVPRLSPVTICQYDLFTGALTASHVLTAQLTSTITRFNGVLTEPEVFQLLMKGERVNTLFSYYKRME